MKNPRKYLVTIVIDGNKTEVESTSPEFTIRAAYGYLKSRKNVTMQNRVTWNSETGALDNSPMQLFQNGKPISFVKRIG